MIRRLLSVLYICCIATISFATQQVDLKEMYAQLDQAISNAPYYKQKQETRISQLKQVLGRTHNKQTLLDTYRKLYEAYKSYQSDSAIVYLQKGIQIARDANMQAEVNDMRSLLALQYSTSGAFTEALDVLKTIHIGSSHAQEMQNYSLASYHVYGELGFNNIHTDTELSQAYFHQQDLYRDTLLAILPHHSETYLRCRETMLNNAQEYKKALAINDERLAKCEEDTHEYGIVAYYRYLIYRALNNQEMVKYWLIKSAICDVKNCVNDQASLWILADLLSKEGETERAYKYINFSWNANKEFSTRIRSWQISPTLGSIDHNYQQQLKKANVRLTYAIVCVSLLVIFLAFSVYYINKQKALVTLARNELKESNMQLELLNMKLQTVNEKLQASNEKLNESNGVKEEYIGQFLGACSLYIDKLDKLRLSINKLVKAHKYQEIYELTRSSEQKDKELDELYSNFDNVFLHLFPNFVEDLNGLLKEDYQIHLSSPTKLSAMVRVFALIRLGIDDSAKIAEFLHYAINTIYN